MRGGSHDWQKIGHFEDSHERCLREVEEYFVIAHDLQEPVLRSSTWLRYRGIRSCHGGIEIHVDHRLERDHSDRIRPARVRYHAHISKLQVINIVRYGNSAHYPDHPDAFHKHFFDAFGHPAGVQHIGRQDFPTLRSVIDEVFEW